MTGTGNEEKHADEKCRETAGRYDLYEYDELVESEMRSRVWCCRFCRLFSLHGGVIILEDESAKVHEKKE